MHDGKNEGIGPYFKFCPTKQRNEEKASLPKFGLLTPKEKYLGKTEIKTLELDQ
ncbi:hypothetical protein PEDI_42550 [Persicobacter diffluens]|uniref:Uncharacterized protein n=1 Tax=Persicobacter diffluens TaxID=981 RepID=A0AAN5APD0_9BACT|nr:hypothetical protein PEDI_42550 [Persicobacter diffluens]